MEFNIRGFIDVFTWEVSWLDANFFWVLLSFLIYVFLILFFIWLVKTESNEPKPSKEEKKSIKKAIFENYIISYNSVGNLRNKIIFIMMFE